MPSLPGEPSDPVEFLFCDRVVAALRTYGFPCQEITAASPKFPSTGQPKSQLESLGASGLGRLECLLEVPRTKSEAQCRQESMRGPDDESQGL